MQKFILMLLLAGLSNNAMAEMVEIGKGSDGEIVDVAIAVDPVTVHRIGNTATVWGRLTYSKPQKFPGHSDFMSKLTQIQCDCTGKLTRTLYTNYFAEKEGKGKKLFFENPSNLLNWNPVSPGTVYEKLFKYACDKKHW